MTKKNFGRIDELAYDGSAGADAGMPHHPMYGAGNGFALQHTHPSAPPPPLHPLAHPFEGATTNPRTDSPNATGRHPRDGARPAASATYARARPAAKRRSPNANAVAPPTPVKSRKTSASQASPSQQNPYSTSRGLRHFSMKVCEKVEERGTTTYNEVADELVRELKLAEEAIATAAVARGGEIPVKKKKSKKPSTGKAKKNHDDKNIRRRVYDALNVLMAMDIITKDKKEITWQGLPGSDLGDAAEPGDDRKANGLSRRQRVRQLEEDLAQRRDAVRDKKECLRELLTQNTCFHNLLRRNHAQEKDARRREASPTQYGEGPVSSEQGDNCELERAIEERIPLPFIIVNTDSRAVIQCEMCPARTNVSFDFSLPFEINDDNEILKRLGMASASKESLQRSLPPDLFHYCNGQGLLEVIARPS